MDERDRSAVLAIAANAPPLVIRLGLQYLRVKRQANRARGRFYRELVLTGVPREQAAELADEYVAPTSVRAMIKSVGDMPFSSWMRRE